MSPRRDLGLKPLLGYMANDLERAAERRGDAAFLSSLESNGGAVVYAIGGELVVLKKTANGPDPLFTLPEARALAECGETIFLGLRDGVGRLGVGLDPRGTEQLKQNADLIVTDLRSIAYEELVDPVHLAAIAEAKAMLHWHQRHRFCAGCGAPTAVVQGGWRRDCPSCGLQHFPRTDPVVIMLAVRRDQCLLGRQARFLPGMWSCLAGFVEPGETVEHAVRRETREEAGIDCGRIEYFASQPWPFPMSLMIGCHAEAITADITIDPGELDEARWFDRDEVERMLLRRHPSGFFTPAPFAIAHHIIRAWLAGEAGKF